MTDIVPGTRPVLLLPGQGGQFPLMATDRYADDDEFAAILDRIFELLGDLGEQVRADWLTDEPVVQLDHVSRSQVLIFAIDYALGRTLLDQGLKPVALLGHSMGEVAAAALAGVFTLPDAVALVRDRVEQLAAAVAGGMAAVAAAEEDVRDLLGDTVAVAAVNGPRRTIVAGPDGPLARAVAALRAAGYVVRAVPATTPYHSPAVRPYAAASLPFILGLPRRAPQLPLWSCYTGGPMSRQTAVNAEFWALQPAQPVRFWTALDALLREHAEAGPLTLIEAGPGTMLSTAAFAHPAVDSGQAKVVTLLPPQRMPGTLKR